MTDPVKGPGGKLTAKQARFVQEYLIDLNATQAALRAGYSAKTAEQLGYQLLQKTSVQARISEAQKERSERTGIDAAWVLTRLATEANADLADLYDENGGLKPVHDWPLIWRQGLVAGIDIEELRVDGEVAGTVRKIKISDRIKRIELIGKHVDVQAFKDQIEHKGGISLTVSQDDAEL